MIGSLHDLTCNGPDDCTCKATYIAKPTPRPKREPKRLSSKPHVIPWRVRQEVIDRDEATCRWCEVPGGALDCHHRLPRSAGGKDDLLTLISCHRQCHRFIHDNPSVARSRGFLVRSVDEL